MSVDALPLSGGRIALLLRRAVERPFLAGLGEALAAERSRWPLWGPALLGVGIGFYFWLLVEPADWIAPVAVLVAAIAALLAHSRPRLFLLALAILAVAIGFAAAKLAASSAAAPMLERRIGPVVVEGKVLEVDLLPEGRRVIVAPRAIGRERGPLPARIRIRLAKGGEAVAPGDWFSVRAILMPPPAPAMPGAYDFQRQAYFDRLGGVGYAIGPAARIEAPAGEGPAGWRLFVAQLRHAMTERIVAVLKGGTGGVAAALITGEMGPIPAALNQAYRDSGLAHLLSISGIHMSLVAGIAFVALRAGFALIPWVALRFPIKKWAAGLALLLVVAYTLLSGATVPAQRSCLMIALALLAVMVDRLQLSMRVIAWAAVAVMLWTPVGMLGPSFQMSFGAVVALIAFYETFNKSLGEWRRDRGPAGEVMLYFAGIVFTTVVATLATTPYSVFHFNRFAVYSLPANMAAVPITGFWIMPWAMIACLLMPFGLEAWGLVPMGWGVDAINWVAETVAAWPGAVLSVPAMPMIGLVLITLGGLWLCIWQRRWRLWGIVPIVLGGATIFLERPPDIVASADSRVIAVRAGDGSYMLSTARPGKIIEETWTRRGGAEFGAIWPETGQSADGRLVCDRLGCLYRAGRRTVALVRDAQALGEDCRTADLVVAQVPARRSCRSAPAVVDRIDLWRWGTHAIWLESQGIRIESVDRWRGTRPWVPVHRTRAEREAAASEGPPQ